MNFREGKKEKKGIQTTTIVVMDCVLGSVTVSEGILRGSITFHVALSFEDEESVTSTIAFFVANDVNTFYDTVVLKFTCEITICCSFVLEGKR